MDEGVPTWAQLSDLVLFELACMLDANTLLSLVRVGSLRKIYCRSRTHVVCVQSSVDKQTQQALQNDGIWEHLAGKSFNKWDVQHLVHMRSVRDQPTWLS